LLLCDGAQRRARVLGEERDRQVRRGRMFEEHCNGGSPSKARLLVLDDQAFMRVAIQAILATDSFLEVVGEA
jgi:hypothetical protein